MRQLLVLVLSVVLAGCSTIEPPPSESATSDPLGADVPGAAASTDWLAGDTRLWLEGSLARPDAEQAVGAFLARVRGTFPEIDVRSEMSGPDESGVYHVVARGAFPPSDLPLRAVDFRFEVRQSAEGWVVDALEERHHCRVAPAQPFCNS
jgi:hypothetical protein